MKESKSSVLTKIGNTEITRADKIALIKDVKEMIEHLDYVSVAVFEHATECVAAAFARGRQMPTTDVIFDGVVAEMVRFSRRSKTPEGRWFLGWVKKTQIAHRERLPSQEGISAQIAKHIFPKVTLELGDFGYASASDLGPEIAIVSMAGFLHVFPDDQTLRAFALDLMEAANEIERSRSIALPSPIPDEYEATAVTDYQDQIDADAYLYRKGSEEEE